MITLEVKDMWDFQICMKRKQNYQSHFLNKPPYAERHVGWCERTTKLEIYLTLSPTRFKVMTFYNSLFKNNFKDYFFKNLLKYINMPSNTRMEFNTS
jgi:hypothetical protein